LAGEADTAAAGETVSSFDKERGPILYGKVGISTCVGRTYIHT
jgi:hypothetical protein